MAEWRKDVPADRNERVMEQRIMTILLACAKSFYCSLRFQANTASYALKSRSYQAVLKPEAAAAR